MDTSRTKRRFALYEKSVTDFINYFNNDDRIVKIDTSAAQLQHVWDVVMDFFAAEMDFSASRVINTVVLFSFGKSMRSRYSIITSTDSVLLLWLIIMFCVSRDTRVSYGWCLLMQDIFVWFKTMWRKQN